MLWVTASSAMHFGMIHVQLIGRFTCLSRLSLFILSQNSLHIFLLCSLPGLRYEIMHPVSIAIVQRFVLDEICCHRYSTKSVWDDYALLPPNIFVVVVGRIEWIRWRRCTLLVSQQSNACFTVMEYQLSATIQIWFRFVFLLIET